MYIRVSSRNAEKLKTISDVPDVYVVSPRKSIEPDTTFVKELIVKIRSRSGIQRFTMKHVNFLFCNIFFRATTIPVLSLTGVSNFQ